MTTTLKKQGVYYMRKNITVRKMIYSAIAAALYVALTLAIAPLSYQAVQFRLSEVMVFLAFIDPWYIPGLTLGCFLANLFGPYGLVDAVGGGLATLFSVGMIALTARWGKTGRGLFPSLLAASLWPSVSALIIAFEIVFFTGAQESYWYWAAMVAVGEFGVVTVCGVPLMYWLYQKKPQVIALLKIQ